MNSQAEMHRLQEIEEALEMIKDERTPYVMIPKKEVFMSDIEWMISSIRSQQKEIDQLKADKQALSHYKFMYEQARQ